MPTKITTFRFEPETLADLDLIADHLAAQGHGGTRADAIRYAARQLVLRLNGSEKRAGKNSEKRKDSA